MTTMYTPDHLEFELRAAPEPEPETIEKVSIIVSKGSLEGIYPGLIMANGARMEGIEADLFFTFFGLDAIRKDRYEKIKVATVGNPGLHMPTLLGAIPGFSALATKMMSRQMEKIDIPPIPEFMELVSDSGVRLFACKATVDMFELTMDDFIPQVEGIISVGEFYEQAAGGEIIFTYRGSKKGPLFAGPCDLRGASFAFVGSRGEGFGGFCLLRLLGGASSYLRTVLCAPRIVPERKGWSIRAFADPAP